MSAAPIETEYLTPEEYLQWEALSETKHEYADGFVYAMEGASRIHNVLTGNIFVELHRQLRGKKCRPFSSDMRLRIAPPPGIFFYYPDVAVDCSGSDSN